MSLVLVGAAFAVTCGVLLGLQPAVNAELGRRLASPFNAALVSILLSTMIVLPFALAEERAPLTEALSGAPWWIWIGGVTGAFFVAAGITFAPLLGIALFMVLVVSGQLFAAALIDHFALFGVQERPLSTARGVGLGLVLIGVLIFRFGEF